MAAIRQVEIEEVEHVAYRLACENLNWDSEPIPEFYTRYEGILESCLAQPFLRIQGTVLYPGLVNKASILFYLLNKNHPFKNGNKRIAIFTLQLFLARNNKWLWVTNEELYNFALQVSESTMDQQGEIFAKITSFISDNIIPFSDLMQRIRDIR